MFTARRPHPSSSSSSGGQIRDRATLPEIRLAIGDPNIDLGNIETALDDLRSECHYLRADAGEYGFSTKPNLNRLIARRRGELDPTLVLEAARTEIRRVFLTTTQRERSLELVFFPASSAAVSDVPAFRVVVLGPEMQASVARERFLDDCLSRYGDSSRRFKNALVWVMADVTDLLLNAASAHRAWDSLSRADVDPEQFTELSQHQARALAELRSAVLASYRRLAFLGAHGGLEQRAVDPGEFDNR